MKKKIAIIGIVLLTAMLLLTCEAALPVEEEIEYTDVVYSEDGSQVTLYLDGVGVPITKTERAMSLRLAKMAYDFLDVVFVSKAVGYESVARAQWEIGQAAGISGVPRGLAAGISYSIKALTSTNSAALIAAGKKDGKTLLGIGEILDVDGVADTTATITPDTKSVTFYITSVRTGLLVGSEAPGSGTENALGIVNDNSLIFATLAADTPNAAVNINAASKRTNLGNWQIPTYPLPDNKDNPTRNVFTANYTFAGAPDLYKNYINYAKPAAAPTYIDVEQRLPRYLDNGKYKSPPANPDMRSTVEVVTKQPGSFTNVVDLKFTRLGTGVFSFYIEIPVYILTDAAGLNTGKLPATVWKIRTGLGSELYSLDDGLANGGCVLMTIGEVSMDDWLEIETAWVDYPAP